MFIWSANPFFSSAIYSLFVQRVKFRDQEKHWDCLTGPTWYTYLLNNHQYLAQLATCHKWVEIPVHVPLTLMLSIQGRQPRQTSHVPLEHLHTDSIACISGIHTCFVWSYFVWKYHFLYALYQHWKIWLRVIQRQLYVCIYGLVTPIKRLANEKDKILILLHKFHPIEQKLLHPTQDVVVLSLLYLQIPVLSLLEWCNWLYRIHNKMCQSHSYLLLIR